MCLHDVGRVTSVDDRTRTAAVDLERGCLDVSLLALDAGVAVRPGTWVVVYHGYAIEVVSDEQARSILDARHAIGPALEPEPRTSEGARP